MKKAITGFIITVMAFALVFAACDPMEGSFEAIKEKAGGWRGDGTEANPFKVYDVATLQRVGKETGAGKWNLTAHYRQTQNIDMSGESFTPIGNNSTDDIDSRFTGSFNGNNYTIANLEITDSAASYQGLFGYIDSGGLVEKVGLKDVNIIGNDYVGGIAGINSKGTIQNCFVTGTVKGGDNVGGVTGQCFGPFTGISATVQNCYSTADVTGRMGVGGVAGAVYGSLAVLKNCYSAGDVQASGYSAAIVGGIAGNNESGKIQYCYATGDVYSDKPYVGGVVGVNGSGGSVYNCVALNKNVKKNEPGAQLARVVGEVQTAVLNYNYARNDMILMYNMDGDGTTKAPDPGLNKPDGENTSINIYENFYTLGSNWVDNGWDFTNIWQWSSYINLPILRNMPTGLQDHSVTP